MQGGEQQREGHSLVDCPECPGNVRLKKPLRQAAGSQLAQIVTIQFISENQRPAGIDSRAVRVLPTTEQAFVRTLEIDSEWVDVETGWVRQCSQLVIQNRGTSFQVQPSPEEIKAAEGKVIELGRNGEGFYRIHPGMVFCGAPVQLAGWQLRCPTGLVHCEIYVFPE